jgi:hypothetical protein
MQLGGDGFGVVHRVRGKKEWREILPWKGLESRDKELRILDFRF